MVRTHLRHAVANMWLPIKVLTLRRYSIYPFRNCRVNDDGVLTKSIL